PPLVSGQLSGITGLFGPLIRIVAAVGHCRADRCPIGCSEALQRHLDRPSTLSTMKFLEAVFDECPAGIAEIDLAGVIIDANRALHGILGLRSGELVGTSLREVFHPADAPEACRAFDELVTGRGSRHEGEIRYLAPSGAEVTGRTRISLVRDQDGAPTAVLLFLEDRTVFRATEHALRAEVDGYEQLWQAAS